MSRIINLFPISVNLTAVGKRSIIEQPSPVDTMAKPYQIGTNPCLSEVASTKFLNAVTVLGLSLYLR